MRTRGRRSTSGFAIETVLIIVGILGATQLVPNWRPANWFKKPPPTKQLATAETAQTVAENKVKALQAQLDSIAAANEAKKTAQLSYSHEMVAGAIASNAAAPESTEKAITDSLLQRADLGLSDAIGKLDPALQAEVVGIVAQLRSGDRAKIEAANAMLAEKDKELQQATAARVQLEATQASTAKARDAAVADAAKTKAVVTKLTAQVAAAADKSYAKEQEAGSLGALVEKMAWVIAIIVFIIIFANWILPSLAQEFPGIGWLVALNKTVKSLTSAHV